MKAVDFRERSRRVEMRDTRVLYVEDDPSLMGIMSQMLNSAQGLEIMASVSTSKEALDFAAVNRLDVALLDIALGQGSATGIELAFSLRRLQPNIGIVLFSQHATTRLVARLTEQKLESWSVVQKRADVSIAKLAEIVKLTAKGHSVREPEADEPNERSESVVDSFAPRQREIMLHLASGADAIFIADSLGLSPVTIRQELSKLYKLLVPSPAPGTDLRTSAVVRYLRETRDYN